MGKIRLQLDTLAVESFDTTQPLRAEGTVEGHQFTIGCQPITDGCQTADPTCYRTCASCGGETCYSACLFFTCTCDCTLQRTFCLPCNTGLDCGPG
jgi:hypothetical protein